jgi:DNA-binding SARP family transcriptional activator
VHHVVKYDNLWDIAKHELGDPNRWREIYILNRGHVQANGYALTDPDEIHIGWVLALPANDAAPAAPAPGHTEPPAQTDPAAPATPAAPAAPAPSAIASADPSPAVLPSANSASTAPTAPIVSTPSASAPAPNETQHHVDRQAGVSMPSQGWVSLGLAATIAAVAALLRLHRRRRARLGFPIPIRTGPHPAPVPPPLAAADAAGTRELNLDPDTQTLPGVLPAPPAVPAPVGVDTTGAELSLFDLPGPGIALHGAGAQAVARAVLASTLATGILETMSVRPVVVTTTDTLAQLLPEGVEPAGLDPDRTSFDGERLIVLTDTAAAVTHAEEEMIHRRRLLDTFDADSVTALNARTDHAEHQPPYLLLVQGNDRYAARIGAVAAHRTALHLHTVILGDLDGIPGVAITTDGTPDSSDAQASASTIGRLATLGPANLAQVLAMLTEAAPRPERGIDIDDPIAVLEQAPTAVSAEVLPDIPAPSSDAPAPVRLTVLGPVTVTTDVGPVTTGMRSGSYTVLAVLAAHPTGRTLDQITACLYPDADPGAVNRVRTDITSARKVLRAATGDEEQRFIVYDPAATRYRLDPDSIEVDLWRMLTAIGAANTAADDAACLTALHQAAGMYRGDFADGQDRAWAADYATTYRHQILNVYARIAELLEADQPDQAVAALERAMDLDPVNEELYQRIMRIHGRQHRPEAVRRTLRRLEQRLADLGEAEPSEATQRVAERQLRPATSSGARA